MAFKLIILEYRIRHALRSFGDFLIAFCMIAGGAAIGASAMHYWDSYDTRDSLVTFKQVIADERDASARRFADQVSKLTGAFQQVVDAKDAQIRTLQQLNAAQALIIGQTAKVSAKTAVVATQAAKAANAAVADVKRTVDSTQQAQLKSTVKKANEKVIEKAK